VAEKKTAGASGPLASIEKPVMDVASKVPVPQVKTWLSAYFHPMETFEANKKQANAVGIATQLVYIGLVSWLAVLISSILVSVFSMNFAMVAGTLIGIILFPIMAVVVFFIGSAVFFVIAKLFGGKGSYMEQTLAMALAYGGAIALGFPFAALSFIPVLGLLLSLVNGLIGLYNFYNYYLVVKALHQLTTVKAALVVIIPVIIAIIVAFVLAAALTVMMAAAGLGAAAGGMTNY
jgi:hypothetical protein